MTFISGTISPTANPGPALYAALEPTLLAVGYTLDDTVVISSRTHKMLKSPAGVNSRGQSWYLNFAYNNTGNAAGVFTLRAFEDFNPSTDLAFRGPHNSSSSVIDPATFSRYGTTGYALNSNNWAGSSGWSETLATGAFNYWASITPDRIILAVSTYNYVCYAGFFETTSDYEAKAGAGAFPLICGVVNNNIISSYGSIPTLVLTRVAPMTDFAQIPSENTNWQISVFADGLYTPRLLASGAIGSLPSVFTNTIEAVPFPVCFGGSSFISAAYFGSAKVGQLSGLASVFRIASVALGDTVTIGSDTWVVVNIASTGLATILKRE